MINLNEKQLKDLFEQVYKQGIKAGSFMALRGGSASSVEMLRHQADIDVASAMSQARMISGGSEDSHKVEPAAKPAAPKLVLPTPEQVMHVVMKFQWEDRKNGTGTTNWAANLGMTVVEYVARLNADASKEMQ